MSNLQEETASDDEFQDALTDVANAVPQTSTGKSQAENDKIEELINKQMNLNDDEEQTVEVTGAKATNDSDDGNESDTPEYLEEDIPEEILRDSEKRMSPEQLLSNKEQADKMKLEANEIFKNGDALKAIEIYTEALRLCPTTYTKERAILSGNRAAAKIRLGNKESAIGDCTYAIQLWPDYVRARIRRAKLYELEDKLELAFDDYKHVYELDPSQPDAREACVRLPPIINERNEKLKEEMLSKLKDLGNTILKPFGLSTSNFQMQQDPNTGSYSINFNQNSNSS